MRACSIHWRRIEPGLLASGFQGSKYSAFSKKVSKDFLNTSTSMFFDALGPPHLKGQDQHIPTAVSSV